MNKKEEKMPFEKLIGNEEIKELLTSVVKNNKVSHSYMFIGQVGIGKLQFAKEFSKMILCKENCGCNICEDCIKFNSTNHPDFNIVEKEDRSIKIDQIRQMISSAHIKPIMSNKKIYIINDSQYMTREAQNSLLKTLEEPTGDRLIILIAENENVFLNTIKSRCTKIVFRGIKDDILKDYLKEKYNVQDFSNTMLKMYNGSIKKAIEMQENKQMYESIDKLLFRIEQLDLIDFLNSSDIIYKSKDNINDVLEYINIILFELSVKKIEYLNCISFVEDTKKRIWQNSNFDMSIDNLLIKTWEEINEKHNRS